MHICHVNLAGGFSGGERQTVNLIRQLAEAGFRQTLIARPGNRLFSELEGTPFFTARECRHFLLGHVRADDSWDIVHCHDGKGVYWGMLEFLLRKTPYVITRRVDNPVGKGKATKLAYNNASRVVCLSSEIRRVVHQRFPAANTDVIPSSFSGFASSPEKVAAIRENFPGKILVGQVGRLLKHKGYHITIEAARELAINHPDIQFLFIGEGPDESWLRDLASGVPNIEFVGFQNEVGNWLAALDVFVFPSLSEGLGSTILEAMQHDVPVIGARAGGIPDLIKDRENGLLVRAGDSTALAEALEAVVTNPDQRTLFAEHAKKGLEKYSPQAIARRYGSLYESVLSGAHLFE